MTNPGPHLIAGQQVWLGHSSADGLEFLPDGTVDLTVTSPPYFNIKTYSADPREVGRTHDYQAYLDDLDRVWAACRRVSRPGAVLAVNVRDVQVDGVLHPLSADVTVRLRAAGWELLGPLVWQIPNALPSPSALRERQFDVKHEMIVLARVPGGPHHHTKPRIPHSTVDRRPGKQNPDGRCLGSVIRCSSYRPPNIASLGYHQAAWPDEIATLLVHTFSPPGATILDPFLGSGTTLKVARHLGRRGVGVELDPGLLPLLTRRIAREGFLAPNWADLDATNPTVRSGPRRADLATGGIAAASLFD